MSASSLVIFISPLTSAAALFFSGYSLGFSRYSLRATVSEIVTVPLPLTSPYTIFEELPFDELLLEELLFVELLLYELLVEELLLDESLLVELLLDEFWFITISEVLSNPFTREISIAPPEDTP